MPKYRITFSESEKAHLLDFTKKYKKGSIHNTRAYILLACEGSFLKQVLTNEEIAKLYGVSTRSVEKLRKQFVEEGFEACFITKPRGGSRMRKFDGRTEAHLISLRCSAVPSGYNKWTLRLLAEKMVELSYVESISKDSVDKILKKTNLNLGK
jgi:transposase